jgi:pre-mRNA-processing factor 19
MDALTAKGKELSKARKKREAPVGLAPLDDVKSFAEKASFAPHSTKAPGVTCLDLHPAAPLAVSGGLDKTAVVYDLAAGRVVATLAGHGKKLSAALFHRGGVLTASADKTVKVWDGAYGEAASIGDLGDVTGLSVQPTGDYAASCSKDGHWNFLSLNYGTALAKVAGEAAYNGVCFHPDGLLLGLAAENNLVEIWDMKTQKKIHAFEGHTGAAAALDFNENGYYMASTAADGEVKLWDLRKLKNLNTYSLPGSKPGHVVKFDYSGTYLAAGCGGGEVVVTAVKEWDTACILTGHGKEATAVCFSKDATRLASASLDRTVKLWGK